MVAGKRTGILKERQLNITNTFVYTQTQTRIEIRIAINFSVKYKDGSS